MQKRGMTKDFSWDQSAYGYTDVYVEAVQRGCDKDLRQFM